MPPIMAIDFGRKKIGLAVTDETKTLIKPLGKITFNQKNSWSRIQNNIQEYSPEKILIGLPGYEAYGLSGNTHPLVKEIREFKTHLQKLFPLTQIAFFEEERSSKEAKIILEEIGKKPSRLNKELDSVAAAVILRQYLDTEI